GVQCCPDRAKGKNLGPGFRRDERGLCCVDLVPSPKPHQSSVEEAMSEDYDLPKGELMRGKRGLVMGVANKNSIAWGIAAQLAAQGAELVFTYMGEGLERRVRPLADS